MKSSLRGSVLELSRLPLGVGTSLPSLISEPVRKRLAGAPRECVADRSPPWRLAMPSDEFPTTFTCELSLGRLRSDGDTTPTESSCSNSDALYDDGAEFKACGPGTLLLSLIMFTFFGYFGDVGDDCVAWTWLPSSSGRLPCSSTMTR
jgi:hypothetical protein